jgi:hypothetical protein
LVKQCQTEMFSNANTRTTLPLCHVGLPPYVAIRAHRGTQATPGPCAAPLAPVRDVAGPWACIMRHTHIGRVVPTSATRPTASPLVPPHVAATFVSIPRPCRLHDLHESPRCARAVYLSPSRSSSREHRPPPPSLTPPRRAPSSAQSRCHPTTLASSLEPTRASPLACCLEPPLT